VADASWRRSRAGSPTPSTSTSITRPCCRRSWHVRGGSVTYSLVETSGPDHDRRFTSVALVEGAELGRGSGGSKKASEQEAAREALEQIARAGQ
jgi:dsRNA-specific ribonuclease